MNTISKPLPLGPPLHESLPLSVDHWFSLFSMGVVSHNAESPVGDYSRASWSVCIYIAMVAMWFCRYCLALSWVILSILGTVIIILSATISVHYTASHYTDDDGLQYSPFDTRIIPVSNALCQGLRLTVEGSKYGLYCASLYMLKSPPTLTDYDRFEFYDLPSIPADHYKYYTFYMYPGSNFTVSVCISGTFTGHSTFKLIKSSKTFKEWVNSSYHVPSNASFDIDVSCHGNRTKSYNVTEEDYYYLVFDTDDKVSLDIDVSFYRTLYHFNRTAVSDTCSVTTEITGTSCSVKVPLSGETAFVTLWPLDIAEDWKDGIKLATYCEPRQWGYVAISIFMLVMVTSVMACASIRLCGNKTSGKQRLTDDAFRPIPRQFQWDTATPCKPDPTDIINGKHNL